MPVFACVPVFELLARSDKFVPVDAADGLIDGVPKSDIDVVPGLGVVWECDDGAFFGLLCDGCFNCKLLFQGVSSLLVGDECILDRDDLSAC